MQRDRGMKRIAILIVISMRHFRLGYKDLFPLLRSFEFQPRDTYLTSTFSSTLVSALQIFRKDQKKVDKLSAQIPFHESSKFDTYPTQPSLVQPHD